MKKKYKLMLFIGLPIAIIVGLIGWLGWSGSTDHIKSVADQFKADSSWKLVNESSAPPRTLCIAQVCPRLSRTWTTPTPVTQKQVLQILKKSNWNDISVDLECEDTLENRNNPFICILHGHVDKYTLSVYIKEKNSVTHTPTVGISLE